MPQLDPTWFASQLFWLFVTFIVLYVVLSKIILPPLMGVMAQRKHTVDSDLSTAQGLKTQAEEARELYERTLAEARARSQQLLADAMLEHKQRAETAGKELDRQIVLKLSNAEKQINTKKQELMDALTPTATELTKVIVEKLTKRTPDNDKAESLINSLAKGGR